MSEFKQKINKLTSFLRRPPTEAEVYVSHNQGTAGFQVIYTACKKSSKSVNIDSDFVRLDNIHFRKCPSKSIDYAVMEKTNDAVVVPFDGVWSDIGSWDTLWKAKPKDTNNNVIEGDVILDEVSNSYV